MKFTQLALNKICSDCSYHSQNSAALTETGKISVSKLDISPASNMSVKAITRSNLASKMTPFIWYGSLVDITPKRDYRFFVFSEFFAKIAVSGKNQKLPLHVALMHFDYIYSCYFTGLKTLSLTNLSANIEQYRYFSFWSCATLFDILQWRRRNLAPGTYQVHFYSKPTYEAAFSTLISTGSMQLSSYLTVGKQQFLHSHRIGSRLCQPEHTDSRAFGKRPPPGQERGAPTPAWRMQDKE